jgi:hypothetical protein
MKKSVFILAMLLMAATAFSQTSRRTANSQKPATEEQAKSTAAKSQRTGKESTIVRKDNNVQKNTTTKRSASQVSKSSVSSGRSEAREDVRQTSTRSTANSSSQAQGTIRRSNVNGTGNPSQHTASAGNSKQSRQATPYHAQGSVNANTGTKYVTYYQSPRLYQGTRVIRYHYRKPPRSRLYRARHFPYRIPGHVEIYWTPAMRTEYIRIYPMVTTWRYPVGYRIQTISAYDAILYHGEVMNVYGKVYEVFYSRQTDEYILYFGAYYPYHDMSVVVPGWIARRMSRWPEEYFERQYVIVTGLITTFEDKPEIVIRNTGQLRIY